MVVRAHGVLGLVRARATGPTLAGLRSGEHVIVTDREGRAHRLALASHAAAGGTVLLGFEGVVSREDADVLRGGTISVDASRLPQMGDPGEFYVRDLVGCAVVMDGYGIGTVRDVINRPANDVLEVVDEDGGTQLLPFTRDAVIGIDMPARRIELRAGLVDRQTASGTDDGDGSVAG
jgi:16S rRNA processing protein RimM